MKFNFFLSTIQKVKCTLNEKVKVTIIKKNSAHLKNKEHLNESQCKLDNKFRQ